MPLLSLGTFIKAEEAIKATVIKDLAKFNYDSKEQEEIIESIHIYNKGLQDAVNECLEHTRPYRGKGLPNVLERMSQMNNVTRTRGARVTSRSELATRVLAMLAELGGGCVQIAADEAKTEEQIDAIVTDEVQNYCTNLNWGQFESITKIEIADEILKMIVSEAVEDVVKIPTRK